MEGVMNTMQCPKVFGEIAVQGGLGDTSAGFLQLAGPHEAWTLIRHQQPFPEPQRVFNSNRGSPLPLNNHPPFPLKNNPPSFSEEHPPPLNNPPSFKEQPPSFRKNIPTPLLPPLRRTSPPLNIPHPSTEPICVRVTDKYLSIS